MEIVFDVASTEQHFEQILHLQKQNLCSALTAEQQAQQGFVFAEHTRPLLQMMAAHLPQVVAISHGKVIGYNLAMPVAMKDAMPSLIPMFTEFERSTYKGRPLATYQFMVGGQVCVEKDCRGQGLLRRLYHETRNRLPSGYQLCVTEVAARNSISLKQRAGKRLRSIQVPAFQCCEQELSFFFARALRMILRRWRASP